MKIVVQVKRSKDDSVSRAYISLDDEGLKYLKDELGNSANFRKPMQSVDLFTEEWGGEGLTAEEIVEDCEVVHHLEFLYLGKANS